jgi:hypothetical protein
VTQTLSRRLSNRCIDEQAAQARALCWPNYTDAGYLSPPGRRSIGSTEPTIIDKKPTMVPPASPIQTRASGRASSDSKACGPNVRNWSQ